MLAQLVDKIELIAHGNLRLFIDTYFRLPIEQCGLAQRRRQACRGCDQHTYIKRWQFVRWIIKNGGIIKFLKEIDDLTGWPPLPDQDYKKGRKLFCRICKCWLPAKSYVESERCPVGNPAWETEV